MNIPESILIETMDWINDWRKEINSYAEKSLNIFVDMLPSKKATVTLHSLNMGCTLLTSFQNYSIEKGRKKNNCTVGKPDKHYYLSQVVKVNVNSDKLCRLYIQCDKNHTLALSFFPKKHITQV